jgi:hypothetical protein
MAAGIAHSGRLWTRRGLIMQTDRLHANVITGVSAYHDLYHQLIPAGTEARGYRRRSPAHGLASWSSDDGHEFRLPWPGSRSGHDLATAAAHSVAGVTAVDCCTGGGC